MFEKFKKFIRKSWLPMTLALFVVVSIVIIFVLLIVSQEPDQLNSSSTITICIFLMLIILAIVAFFVIQKQQLLKDRKELDKSVNYYIENQISSLSIGLIVFKSNGDILWTSDFIEERFGEKIINETIYYFDDEKIKDKFIDFQKIFKHKDYVYKISFNAEEMIMILKDITQEYSSTHFYEIEKLVVGEAEIDNYQLFRTSFSDEDIFSVQSSVKDLFDALSEKYNFVYRQYSDGKFLILTNRNNLNQMILNSFEDFEKLSNVKIGRIRLSLSVGFGTDSSDYWKLIEMAKEGLYQSQTRGGDQITVISSIEKTKRFGSKSEITVVKSKTRIKNVANNFRNKLKDNKIKNVVIYGHKFADLDALGASYVLYEIAKSFGKEAYIQNVTFDQTCQKVIDKYIKEPNEIFVSKSKINSLDKDETMVIIVDCAEESRVENPSVFNDVKTENLFVFDHHRVSTLNPTIDSLNTYIESSASSASEIVTELIQFNEFYRNITNVGAQLLLNGIYLDTNQFKKSTSSRTFAAASVLEEWGANIEETISVMRISQEVSESIAKIVSQSREIKPGFWLSAIKDIVSIDTISMAADDMLKIEGRKAVFVIAQLPKTKQSNYPVYKLSARSFGVNVQLIAEAVGGGGHFDAAAALSDFEKNETFEVFVDNVTQSIISFKE